MNERQTLFLAPDGPPASGVTASTGVTQALLAETLTQLPVTVLLVHASGLIAFANDTARRDIGRTDIVGVNVECILAPLESLRSLAQADLGYSVCDVARPGEPDLYAVVVHDIARAVRHLRACDGQCGGSNTTGICTLCWEQNLLELVGHTGPDPKKEEAIAFCKSAAGQSDIDSDVEAAPIPPPPTWRTDDRSFEQLVSDGGEALLSKEYDAALEAYEGAARLRPDAPGIQMIQGNLERLRELVAARL